MIVSHTVISFVLFIKLCLSNLSFMVPSMANIYSIYYSRSYQLIAQSNSAIGSV